MAFLVYIFGFAIIFFRIQVFAWKEACQAVFSPEAMKISCSPLIHDFVGVIAQCQEKSGSDELTCSVSQCVNNYYDIVTNNVVDETKTKAALKKLSEEDPKAKLLYAEVKKNCLNGQYKKYISSGQECDATKYLTCANVNSLMAPQNFNNSPCSCKTLSENVRTCKPFLQQYLKQINSNKC